jgi:hypothetical protein
MEDEVRTGAGPASVTITSRPDALGTSITSDCLAAGAQAALETCAVVRWRGSEMHHCAARRIAATAVPVRPPIIHEVNVNIGFLLSTDCRFRGDACRAHYASSSRATSMPSTQRRIGAGEIMRRRRHDKVDAVSWLHDADGS